MGAVLEQLGRATAKVHCVSDVDDATTPLVDFQVEDAVAAAVEGAEDELVQEVVDFAHSYAAQVRTDHALFVEAFRAGRIKGVRAT
jgi:predicted nucleotidyltransferase